MKRWLFNHDLPPMLHSLALLLFRCVIAWMMLYGHGWSKFQKFDMLKEKFPVPHPFAAWLSPTMSLGITLFAEVVCCGLLILGLASRVSAAILAIVMGIAAFVIHGKDPMFYGPGIEGGFQELALLYFVASVFLVLTGPGSFSLDAKFGAEKRRMFR
jgi:putative oxidoreductase